MSDIDKMYYESTKEFKVFGIKIAEWTDRTTRFDGKGEFIVESPIPSTEYLEREFLPNKNKDN